jgi:calcineurin-like phosphoesterase family protein
MDWFTADWHLGHDKIIQYSQRPFGDANEMNSVIINNLNDLVMPGDRLFNLGDVAFKGASDILGHWRARINCETIFVILGNHDRCQVIEKHFKILPPQHMYESGDFRMVLNHYAMRVWNHSHHGAGHLYGHSHGKLSPMVTGDGRGAMAFDIGVDCWNFKPLSLAQVKAEMTRRSSIKMDGKNEIDDHHQPRS